MSFEYITENQLDAWVKGNSLESQKQIPTLVSDLISESCPRAEYRRVPRGDSIGQGGFDGWLKDEYGYPPFVPAGESRWEIGTGQRFSKLVDDYRKRTCKTLEEVRRRTTMVLVTPRSGMTDPLYMYKGRGIEEWLKARRDEGDWKGVEVIDGTILTDWLMHFPAIGRGLASRIFGFPMKGVETVEERWNLIESIGDPHSSPPSLFLSNRDNAIQRFNEVIRGDMREMRVLTRFPSQVVDFVCAHIASLDELDRRRVSRRTLIVSSADSWSLVSGASRGNGLIMIASQELRLSEESGTELAMRAKADGHSLVYDAPIGGPKDDLTFRLQDPRAHEIENALLEAGHPSQRVRMIVGKCHRNLSLVLRMLDGRQVYSDWREGSFDLEPLTKRCQASEADD